MAVIQKQRFCKICARKTLHSRHRIFGDGIGCVLTLLTVGLFLLIWIPLEMIEAVFQPYLCQNCGSKN